MNRFIALNLNLANTPFGLKYGEYYSLPVILYDTEQFKKYLSQYPWCFFTNADNESLKVIIKKIDSNYTYLNKEQVARLMTILILILILLKLY